MGHMGRGSCRRAFPFIAQHAGVRRLKIDLLRITLVTRSDRILSPGNIESEQQEIPVFC